MTSSVKPCNIEREKSKLNGSGRHGLIRSCVGSAKLVHELCGERAMHALAARLIFPSIASWSCSCQWHHNASPTACIGRFLV